MSSLQNIDAPRPSNANPFGERRTPNLPDVTSDQLIEGLKKYSVLDALYPDRLSMRFLNVALYAIT